MPFLSISNAFRVISIESKSLGWPGTGLLRQRATLHGPGQRRAPRLESPQAERLGLTRLQCHLKANHLS